MKTYNPPTLITYGNVESITQAVGHRITADASTSTWNGLDFGSSDLRS